MTQVGIEALTGQIRDCLRLARSGEKIVVTEEGRPVAVLTGIGIDERQELRQIWCATIPGLGRGEGARGPAPGPCPRQVLPPAGTSHFGRPISLSVFGYGRESENLSIVTIPSSTNRMLSS